MQVVFRFGGELLLAECAMVREARWVNAADVLCELRPNSEDGRALVAGEVSLLVVCLPVRFEQMFGAERFVADVTAMRGSRSGVEEEFVFPQLAGKDERFGTEAAHVLFHG